MNTNFSLAKVQQLFAQQTKPWWVAGGWAIDLFLGEMTREHEDVDIAILRRDEKDFRLYLSSWELWPGMGANKLEDKPLLISEPLPINSEVLWCRPSVSSPWAFEMLTNPMHNENWLFKRDESIVLPIVEMGMTSQVGIPFLKPEIVLLFKAKSLRNKDQQDFNNCREKLNDISRRWLKTSLEKVHPRHQWIKEL
jgi:hypothetical protein